LDGKYEVRVDFEYLPGSDQHALPGPLQDLAGTGTSKYLKKKIDNAGGHRGDPATPVDTPADRAGVVDIRPASSTTASPHEPLKMVEVAERSECTYRRSTARSAPSTCNLRDLPDEVFFAGRRHVPMEPSRRGRRDQRIKDLIAGEDKQAL
jgi:hypothetical protein